MNGGLDHIFMERVFFPLYHVQTIKPEDVLDLTFFQQTSNYTDTNMQTDGAIPYPSNFMIEGIGAFILSGNHKNIQTTKDSILELSIAAKLYFPIPLALVTIDHLNRKSIKILKKNFGTLTQKTDKAHIEEIFKGMETPLTIEKEGIFIPSQCDFKVKINCRTKGTRKNDVTIGVVLIGTLERPVL